MKKLILLLSFIATSAIAQTDFWQQTNGPIGGSVLALAINANGDVFAGTAGGGVFRSTDNGNNWSQINTGLTGTVVQALTINASGNIFAGTEVGVFRSTDNGDTWTQINTGLTATRVFALAINSSGDIFAGTVDIGICYAKIDTLFRSTHLRL